MVGGEGGGVDEPIYAVILVFLAKKIAVLLSDVRFDTSPAQFFGDSAFG